jgi:3,4-dihydroxy 2-butanone 4-phosphate synthase/GTP cyclohydrolase II
VIRYRYAHETLVTCVASRPFYSAHARDAQGEVVPLRLHTYRTVLDTRTPLALVKGTPVPDQPTWVRVHALSLTDDVLADRGTGRAGLLQHALAQMAHVPAAVLVLLPTAEIQTTEDTPSQNPEEARLLEYGIGAQILRDNGVGRMILWTNTPGKAVVGLGGYGLEIASYAPLHAPSHAPLLA